jgi:hypothetical protein
MAVFAALIAKILESPVVAGILIPSLSRALENFFKAQADRIEENSARKAAKAAKTAEELRLASIKLSDASRRP